MNEDVSLVEFADGIIESTSDVEITGFVDDHGGCDDFKNRIQMVSHRHPIF